MKIVHNLPKDYAEKGRINFRNIEYSTIHKIYVIYLTITKETEYFKTY